MKSPQNFANDSALQFALREMQRLLNVWQFWFVLAAVIFMLTLSGPFGTLEEFNFAPRLAYWGAIAVLTSLPSFTIAFMVNWVGQRKGWHVAIKILVSGVLASVPVTLIVWVISALVAGNAPATLGGFVSMAASCMPIAVGITAVYTLLHRHDGEANQPAPKTGPAFLDRLNPATGQTILSLQAQDHYVEVVTTRGKELVLLRLADAEKELEGLDGMRVHRSWWVAKDAVQKAERIGGKMVLTLKDGRNVPVSRANEKAVRDWQIS